LKKDEIVWSLQWNDNERHEVLKVEDLNRMLDEVAADHDEKNPVLVQVQSPTGEILMIGIGGKLSVLDHIAAGGWPAQHSVGDPTKETIAYRMGSYDSEMPKAYAIPCKIARKAVEHFYRTGRLLEDVTWEND
jgi:Immunity protein Imm1